MLALVASGGAPVPRVEPVPAMRTPEGGYIGAPVPRREDARLLTGRGTFVDDLEPPPRTVPDNPVHALRRRNAGAGLDLGADTLRPDWLGEPLDVGYAISVLHPHAIQPLAAGD